MNYHGSDATFKVTTKTRKRGKSVGNNDLEANTFAANAEGANSVEDDFRNFVIVDPKNGARIGPDRGDIFKGYEALIDDPEDAERCNIRMLGRLASEINNTKLLDADTENNAIPAGYTYFAQFVTHDFVHNSASIPNRLDETGPRPNMRALPLLLDTIYGGGPGVHPYCYQVGLREASSVRQQREKLRLGLVRETGNQAVYQDLPRDSSMARRDCDATRNVCPGGMPDVLIADVRNDDTPILAQIQVLFHHLHNNLIEKYKNEFGKPDFLNVSRICAYIYRTILKEDLLHKLLHGNVYKNYSKKRKLSSFIDSTNDLRVPVEFSNSALRIGHVMVRNEYSFNSSLKRQMDVIRKFTSSSSINMPLPSNWIVNWAKFFNLDNTFQSSRKIRPAIASILADLEFTSADGTKFPNIIERDFLRGFFAAQWSVHQLIRKIRPFLPKEISKYPIMNLDDASRRQHIVNWLKVHNKFLNESDAKVIENDPPLFFYILLEASLPKADGGGDGEHLGVLGSILLAEVFYKTLLSTEKLVDPSTGPKTAAKAKILFNGKIPQNMPELIRAIPLWDVDANNLSGD